MSKGNFDFLNQVLSAPNLDISKLNVSLYDHVPELAKIRDYRYNLISAILLLTYVLSYRHYTVPISECTVSADRVILQANAEHDAGVFG